MEMLPVAYCFDGQFAPFGAVSTLSLVTNSKSPLEIFWCIPEADVGKAEKMRDAVRRKCSAQIEIIALNSSQFASWRTDLHITQATYLRLLLPDAISRDKIVYIDADTLVLGDLGELLASKLGSCVIAGVSNPSAAQTSKVPRLAGDVYVNAGVLVMDLAALRKDAFLEKCKSIYQAHQTELTWHDQCIINKYAEGRKLALHEKWNRMIFANVLKTREFKAVATREQSRVLHFVGPYKPWQEWCNPRVSEFWQGYANRLGVPEVSLQLVSNFNQAIELARVLDMNEDYKEASEVKDSIIKSLLTNLSKKNTA